MESLRETGDSIKRANIQVIVIKHGLENAKGLGSIFKGGVPVPSQTYRKEKLPRINKVRSQPGSTQLSPAQDSPALQIIDKGMIFKATYKKTTKKSSNIKKKGFKFT